MGRQRRASALGADGALDVGIEDDYGWHAGVRVGWLTIGRGMLRCRPGEESEAGFSFGSR